MKIAKKNKLVKTLFNEIRKYNDNDPLVFTDGKDWFFMKSVCQGSLDIAGHENGFTNIIKLEKIPVSEYGEVFNHCKDLRFFAKG